ncbi:MAG: hypothetical protein ABIJ59_19830 [Pseudomonadota bacterium]
MKKKIIGISFLFLVFCLVQPCLLQFGWTQPIASVPEPVYTFETIPEGTHVTHEFVIKNTGDTLLTIIDVLPP